MEIDWSDYDGPLPGSQAYYFERWRNSRLKQHPACNDPEHPGCDQCDETDDSTEGEI